MSIYPSVFIYFIYDLSNFDYSQSIKNSIIRDYSRIVIVFFS